MTAKFIERIKKADSKLNAMRSFEANDLQTYFDTLSKFGEVEVGWRESCGKTDHTAKVYSEWRKLLPEMRKQFNITEERQKHGNSYATNKGGFWNSIKYRIDN